MMTLIALDDEPLALRLIERFAAAIEDVDLKATFTDVAAAADFLIKNKIDVLLSDINMPDMDGLQFVQLLPEDRPLVIFLTAHKEYAHEGFNVDALDYLVKPISAARFQKAIQKAKDILDLKAKAAQVQTSDLPAHFFVFSEYQQVQITIADILYIESMGDYVKIYLVGEERPVITLERLKNMALQLKKHGFERIHRSFVINTAQVSAKQKSKVCIAGQWFGVGEKYLDWDG